MSLRLIAIIVFFVGVNVSSRQPAFAVTITFDEFPADNVNGTIPPSRYAYLGVTFTGTDDGSTHGGLGNSDPGNWDIKGTNGSTFSGYNGASNAMTLTFDAPVSRFKLDVTRSNGSFIDDTFTLNGYFDGAWVESKTVPLEFINEWVTVSLSTIVDEVRWDEADGNRPFGIDNLTFTPVPEPSGSLLVVVGLIATLVVRLRLTRADFVK